MHIGSVDTQMDRQTVDVNNLSVMEGRREEEWICLCSRKGNAVRSDETDAWLI
jgi:hypothetical protein